MLAPTPERSRVALHPGPLAGRAPAALALLLLVGCTAPPAPEEVALDYGRALYAGDARALHRLVSRADRDARDEATVRRTLAEVDGFAAELVRQLAGYITATAVDREVTGARAVVRLTLRLPDANAPAVRALVHDWDVDRLNRLSASERARLAARLAELHRAGTLPMVDGRERFELVREADGWRVVAHWTAGRPVAVAAAADPALGLEVHAEPSRLRVVPGERFRVTLRVHNRGAVRRTLRVEHAVEPAAGAETLALVRCPLFVPVTVAAGATETFVSEYLLLPEAPEGMTYRVRYRLTGAAG